MPSGLVDWAFKGPKRSASDTGKTLLLTTALWEQGDQTTFAEDNAAKEKELNRNARKSR